MFANWQTSPLNAWRPLVLSGACAVAIDKKHRTVYQVKHADNDWNSRKHAIPCQSQNYTSHALSNTGITRNVAASSDDISLSENGNRRNLKGAGANIKCGKRARAQSAMRLGRWQTHPFSAYADIETDTPKALMQTCQQTYHLAETCARKSEATHLTRHHKVQAAGRAVLADLAGFHSLAESAGSAGVAVLAGFSSPREPASSAGHH